MYNSKARPKVGLQMVQISDCCKRSVTEIYADIRWPVEYSSAYETDIRMLQKVSIPDVKITNCNCVNLKQIMQIQILY